MSFAPSSIPKKAGPGQGSFSKPTLSAPSASVSGNRTSGFDL
ncbi:hypothetical protein DFA_07731 [Cavenderia fasciculata]|uniref:Uncharacterized protein n=1 Tax=Cavenderia fasciculata TaxID=261658 RepID=F4Q331_CACFS|nr:uncharacterized protein DFA_07731 [Cavenderia fasciculata]EGG16753.1 hypothetical protein DFA_07731 [Cavenderia fasciculata]|eukprot:XP_004355227.1 hypothetical protein DFA_07731 [Cavenderia fasciculata]